MKTITQTQVTSIMKQLIAISLLILLACACKKGDYGTMKYKARFCTQTDNTLKISSNDTLYTLFGNYITSITPDHFSSYVGMFIFQDHYNQGNPACHMIAFIENQQVEVDFSGNAEIEFSPTLHSTDIIDGIFKQKEVNFRFISFCPNNFMHSFEIPTQYLEVINGSNANQFMLSDGTFHFDSINQKLSVQTPKNFSYGAIHGNANAMPTNFTLTFGQTDSSYVYMYSGQEMPEEDRFPFWDANGVVIRSSKFVTQKIIMPGEGETYTMYATLSFDTNGLIQVYAGNDNIPYTPDDVFVYAPQFWNRINIKLEMKII